MKSIFWAVLDLVLNILFIGVILNLVRDLYRCKKMKIIAKNTIINIIIFFYGLLLIMLINSKLEYIQELIELIIGGLLYIYVKEIKKSDYKI